MKEEESVEVPLEVPPGGLCLQVVFYGAEGSGSVHSPAFKPERSGTSFRGFNLKGFVGSGSDLWF